MTKKLKLIRGPEMVHNKLIHKQYGIIALSGGQLKFGHYNMIQTIVGKNLNYDKSFCIWRIDPPNRSVTKHGQGKKLGGGKGTIDHYMYPVKRGRVIIEVGGNISFQEVSRMLQQISEKLPFPAKVVNQEMMENFEKEEEKLQVENVNKLRWEWAIKNNLLNCLTYAGKYDIEFSNLGPDCR
jgi:large subunit ribosomal protein L16